MKRDKRKARPHRSGAPLQFFDCGPWRFNINKALRLAANRQKYQVEMRRPTADWIGPFIDIDANHLARAESSQPVIFATIVQHGQPARLLIDGNHRVVQALRQPKDVPVVTLDLEDTLKVMTAASGLVEQMRREGVRLGLIQEQPETTARNDLPDGQANE
jgi:hypothetical protein